MTVAASGGDITKASDTAERHGELIAAQTAQTPAKPCLTAVAPGRQPVLRLRGASVPEHRLCTLLPEHVLAVMTTA